MKNLSSLSLVLLLGAGLAVSGCGGGSSGGGGGGGEASLVALYATDSMDGNDHVWVTVNKVQLNSQAGAQVVFDEPNGMVVDLRSLRDGVGAKFSLMTVAPVTGGPFLSATVTMAKDLTVFAAGSSTGVAKQFADVFDTGAGQSAVTFTFTQPRSFGPSDNKAVIDFDLANWVDNGGKVTPVLKLHGGQGLDDNLRHVRREHEGLVSGLVGTPPNQEFDLVFGGGRKFHVKTTSSTLIFNAGPEPNPILANGIRIHVRGVFIASAGYMTAVAIKIQNDSLHHGEAEAKGAPSNLNALANTFDITVREAEGFVPEAAKVRVVLAPNASFRLHRGIRVSVDEFFSALAVANEVEAEGSYDSATNTLTAVRVKTDDDHGGGGVGGHEEAEGKGTVSNLDAAVGTFTLSLVEWEGFGGISGQLINVTTSSQTVFMAKNKDIIDKSTFFAQLAILGHAEVRGTYDGATLTATRCKLED